MIKNLPPGRTAPLPKAIRERYFRGDPAYMRYGTFDDGTCWFHAVVAAMNWKRFHACRNAKERRKLGHRLRDETAARVTEDKWKKFWKRRGTAPALVPPFATTRKTLRDHKAWSDVYIILFLIDSMLKCQVFFFDSTTNRLYCGVKGTTAAPKKTVFMLWVNHSHFEPIFHQGPGKRVLRTFKPRDEIVRHVRSTYNSRRECRGVKEEDVLERQD
jgi:hypothetical protein